MKTERTKKSFFNMSSNFIILIVQIILSFIVRTYFIKILGESNLGIDGLFTNILSMLSLTELGISTAISYILYKPLNDKDINKVSIIMSFYKKVYFIVGITVLLLGFLIVPLISYLVKDYSINNIFIIYFIYLLSTVSMYFISYKEILILADQNNYKLTLINFIFIVSMYLGQIFVLIKYKNFILYLLIMLFTKTVQRIYINNYVSKKYKNINFEIKDKLSKEEVTYLKTNIKSLFFSKIGDYCIFSTDNILISNLVGIVTVGIYTNYASIVTMSRSLINSLFNGIIASFGNLAATEDEKTQQNVFEIIDFMVFILYGLFTIVFLNMINPFINIWLGNKYVLSNIIMIIICFNFYLMGMQVSLDTIKQACGFYNKDKYIPIIQAIINLVLSFILGRKIGLLGILLATTISYIVLPIWNKPYLIYKYIFKSSSLNYFVRQIKNIISLIIIYFLSSSIVSLIGNFDNILYLILYCLIIFIIFVIVIILLYFKTKEFKYLFEIAKKIYLNFKNKF